MKWTHDQQKAIDMRDCNILVSAAAGSGKTAVITQRALNLIVDEGVDISKILMLTFTKAAASEMRTRLGSYLLNKINSTDDKKASIRWMKQLERLNESGITTIDSYCTGLLRRYYHAADIDPEFKILGNDAADYSLRAIKSVLDDAFEESNKDFLEMCDIFGGNGGKDIGNKVLDIYNFARTQPHYIKILSDWVENYNLDEDDIYNTQWVKYLLKDIKAQTDDAIKLFETGLLYARLGDGPIHYEETLINDLSYANGLIDVLNKDDFEEIRAYIETYSPSNLSRKRPKINPELKNECKALRDNGKDIIKSIKSSAVFLPASDIVELNKRMYKPLCVLQKLILDFDKQYIKLKQKRSYMDFPDLLHYAIKALENEDILYQERSRYEHIFVDEYQDTNPLQENLIEMIVSGNNLLCVGDVKQSIYAFRHADPELFVKRRNRSSADNSQNLLINLNQNFRSSPAIISSINLIFDTIMSSKLGGVDYDDDERLYQGAFRSEDDEGGNVSLLIIEKQEREKDFMLPIEKEAVIAAREIKKVMGQKIWDGKKGEYRTARYSDICILAKAFTPIIRPVRSVLEQHGIPVLPQKAGEYFDEIEIAQFLGILTIVDNIRRDLSLITAMTSPAFLFSIDDVLRIRKNNINREVSFCDALIEYSEKKDDLSIKIDQFLDKIEIYRDLARYMSLKDFIWHVLDDTGFYNAVGALPGGSVRQDNLRVLTERANAYSKQPASSLHGFLSYIKRLKKSGESPQTAYTNASDAVRFMSIHNSKGLEFPVVILLGAGKAPNIQSMNSQIVMFKNLGIGTDSYDIITRTKSKTLAKEAVRLGIKNSILSEDMRLFYVALTRAREDLIIIGTLKGDIDKACSLWARPFIAGNFSDKKATFLNYICSSIMRNNRCDLLRDLCTIPPDARADIPNFTAEIIASDSIKLNKQKRAGAVERAMNDARNRNIKREFMFIKESISSIIPAKTSATAMISGFKLGELYIPDMVQGPRYDDIVQYSASQRGTFTHTVLEHIRMDGKNVRDVIKDLIERNILPEDALNAIHISWLERFMKSDIITRAKSSVKLRKEVPFVVNMPADEAYKNIDCKDNVLVQGIIDMCFIEDGKWVLVDYKTNTINAFFTKEMALEHYKEQLNIYIKALEIITGIKVKSAGLYLLSISEMIWLRNEDS